MKKFGNYSLWVLAGAILGLYFGARYSYLINITTHSLINSFASGRSVVKVGLFLWYTLLLTFYSLWLSRAKSFTIKKLPDKWLLISVLTTLTYNLVLFFVYFHKWGLRITDYILTFHNDEMSSTRLLHNHLMKGVNGTVLNWFGIANQENADTGLAFVGLLHSAWYLVGALLFLVSLVLLIWKFIELYKKQTESKSLFVLLYSIVSYSLLKNMLDGGLLNREVPIALTAFIIILIIFNNNLGSDKNKKAASYWWATVPVAAYCVIVAIFNHFFGVPVPAFKIFIYQNITFIGILAVLIYWPLVKKHNAWISAGLILICAFLLYKPLEGAFGTYINSRRLIGPEGAIVSLYNPPNYGNGTSEDWQEMEKINDLTIYKLNPKSPIRINEILANNHILANSLPIHLIGDTCPIDSKVNEINFTLYTNKSLKADNSQYEFISNFIAEPMANTNAKLESLYKYKITMEMESCTPRVISTIEELLQSRGLDTFFITNMSDTNFLIN